MAIKKIKVGQFKDGLDMSAIREVKYLRELKHQNVIDVSFLLYSVLLCCIIIPLLAPRCILFENKPESCSGIP